MWFAPEYAVMASSILVFIFMAGWVLTRAKLPLVGRGLYALGVAVSIYVFMCGVFLFFNWNETEAARLIAQYQMKRFSFLVPYLPYALLAGGALATFAAWANMLPEEEAATDGKGS